VVLSLLLALVSAWALLAMFVAVSFVPPGNTNLSKKFEIVVQLSL
jgi:hypothetical protein